VKTYFDHYEYEGAGVTTFYFSRPRSFKYAPGQYVNLVLPHQNPDDRGTSRSYTLSSSPSEKYLTVTTKTDVSEPSTFTQALIEIVPGSELEISGPNGSFVLPDDPSIPLVFCARGLGITPFRSMARYLQSIGDKRNITLIRDASDRSDALFEDIFHETGIKQTLLIHERFSNVAAQQISQEVLRVKDDPMVYVAGSSEMVSLLSSTLISRGFEASNIVTDTHI
jgi:ferredoxin-NADP reductase